MDTPTTQAPYEIARYLSDEAKRAAVARRYTRTRNRSVLDPYTCPRCESGMCPMGVALMVMTQKVVPTPAAHQVGMLLGGDTTDVPIWRAADVFMEDFDRGRITDLAAALGVS